MHDFIKIRGAREHNLKNLSLSIPRGKYVVVTGPSGSGKSSLAYDTLYADAQRRFVESLSVYARQFLEQLKRPDVDSIGGLSPAIALEQGSASRNPRSTVGTMTEIYDFLRLLFARVGTPWCERFQREIPTRSVESILGEILTLPERTKLQLLSPIVKAKKGNHKKRIEELQRAGYVRLRVDGEIQLIEEMDELDMEHPHTIELVYDRLVLKESARSRLAEGVEACLARGELVLVYETPEGEQAERRVQEGFKCTDCGIIFSRLEPKLFSFNSPYGACKNCRGLGVVQAPNLAAIIGDDNLSIKDGAIAPLHSRRPGNATQRRRLAQLCKRHKVDREQPWKDLPQEFRQLVLYGESAGKKPFEGVVEIIKRRESNEARSYYKSFLSEEVCLECNGTKLCQQARMVLIDGKNIIELMQLSLEELSEVIAKIPSSELSAPILSEISARLKFLNHMGLGYLSLVRTADTLSGGEAQRIRLAAQIGSGLSGVLYVLDEPSSGLHADDNNRLIETLRELRDLGNTVLVVEHDLDLIAAADHVIDLGPAAGENGGYLISEGPPKPLEIAKESTPPPRKPSAWLKLKGASLHNLKSVDLELPLGCFVVIAGVSGSGKSSLLLDTLYPALSNHIFPQSKKTVGTHEKLEGLEAVDKVICVDQQPLGKTPRSNPATYTGIFDGIRDLFAGIEESRLRGWGPGRFSFNVKGGRCESCQGAGVVKVDMQFLPPTFVSCEQCDGKRYNRETLDIRYKGLNISEALELSVNEAFEVFERIPTLAQKLKTLKDVRLGYIKLGQSASTLSGGEAQRVKLATELAKKQTGNTVYILDEPTSGLHISDVHVLLRVLHKLVDKGNTVCVIEHHKSVIADADWVIELGPGAGKHGGEITNWGPPL